MSKPQTSAQTTSPPPRPAPVRHVHPVIEIVNGYKHFGFRSKWGQIMRNFNLTAYKGEIYVLLGPSGSGKSTVTNVILGMCRLNYGFVKIFGFTPGEKLSGVPGLRIGYSPESEGLFDQLTVNETLNYYGKMLRLKKDYINERISEVNELLALPPGKRFIRHCTLMERRQVSFAIAILHEPELIILDEPDHGTDPVTRKCIADHLHILAGKGCTIFMTSKNLLEAESADRVGIVRTGYLLMEGSPGELVSTYKQKNIESLYMHIYSFAIRKDDVERKRSIHDNPYIKIDVLPSYGSEGFIYNAEQADQEHRKVRKKRRYTWTFCRPLLVILPNAPRLAMLLLRDILLSFRNYIWIFFVLLMPLIILILINFTIGQTPKHLKLAIVNFEANEKECETNPREFISCDVLKLLDSEVITKRYYTTYESAEQDSYQFKINGILIIGEKFTNQIMRTLANIDLNNVDIGNPDTSQLILRADTTSPIISNTIEHATKQAVEDYLNEATRNLKLRNATIGYPLKVGVPLYGQSHTEAEFVSNGLAIVLLYHLAAYIAASVLISFREKHLLARDYIAGVRWTETVLSQMIIYGILLMLEGILMYGMLIWLKIELNNGEFKNSMLYIPIVILEQIWCGLCFGILISSIVSNNVMSGCTVFCFLLLTVFLCGVLWPLKGLPEWLIVVVNYLPQTQAIFLIRCMMQRGITSDTQDFYLGYIIPVVWLIVFILLTVLINKIS